MVDATNVQPLARRPLIELARRYHRVPVAIVFDLPEEICQEWNRRRGRVVPRRAVHRHAERLRGSRDLLEGEGFEVVHVLRAPDEIDRARVVRAPSG